MVTDTEMSEKVNLKKGYEARALARLTGGKDMFCIADGMNNV